MENNYQEELEVLNAIDIISRHRAKYFHLEQKGFENISMLVQMVFDIISKPFKCKNCGHEQQIYGDKQ